MVRTMVLCVVLSLAAGCTAEPAPRPARSSPPPGATATGPGYAVLVFSATKGFRHDSIPAGIAAVRRLGADNGFAVEATEDAGAFTDADLAHFQAVIWLSTTGDVLDAAQQGAFERYIRSGGGFVGVHAAADTEYDWAWYGDLVGAHFARHPAPAQAVVTVVDRTHPSTAPLPERWSRTDEWYDFRTNPRPRVHVLATVDESTYAGGRMGSDHPIAWCHDVDGGRSWYTGGGHPADSYADARFRAHLLGGIQYAATGAGDCTPGGGPSKITVEQESRVTRRVAPT